MSKPRVVVAMSGGVDSSVAAAMLYEQGYEVIGITMQLYDYRQNEEEQYDTCCSLSDVHDARVVADRIGFPHYVINYEKEFTDGVIDYFADEYFAGRTPNPCVMCNTQLKFDHLVEKAKGFNADFVATGHYAKIVHRSGGLPSELYRARDLRKDQSYFLYGVKESLLRYAMFPLADLTKPEVREIAEKYHLHTSQKKESQEICFVANNKYAEFLEENYEERLPGSGDIVDTFGKILGRHEGIHRYTVGQRKGLYLNLPVPKFVVALDSASNRVIVGDKEELRSEKFRLYQDNWLVDAEEYAGRILHIVPRYRAKPIPGILEFEKGEPKVKLLEEAAWISPGQAAVVYDKDQVIGGGFITNDFEYEARRTLEPSVGELPTRV